MKLATTTLAFCVAALLALGMVMLYSSSMVEDGARYLVRQMVWGAAGLVVCLMAALLDYHWLKKISRPLLGFSILLLVLVLIPAVGHKSNGARRWFDLRFMHCQPSELAKIALLIALAHYVEWKQRRMHTFRDGLLKPGAFIGVTLGLILLEPDYGCTVLLASVSAALLLVAGVRWKYLLPPALLGVATLSLMIWHNPNRLQRILAFLHPEEHKAGAGWQSYQALLALGSGGWTGLGLGNGRQKLGFVPEHYTDFILSIIGEELGFVATFAVVIAFVLIVVCGIYIAWRARDTFGQMLAAGITFLIGLQAFINIGVVTSALPNKGLPLPFISYGGSNLLLMLACVGLLFSVARQAVVTLENDGAMSENELPVPQVT